MGGVCGMHGEVQGFGGKTCAVCVACMQGFVGKSEGKRSLAGPNCRWENDIKSFK